jgi:hypothetical protein
LPVKELNARILCFFRLIKQKFRHHCFFLLRWKIPISVIAVPSLLEVGVVSLLSTAERRSFLRR